MKKQSIKISQTQLRNLINEAIEGKQFGSPEPFSVPEKKQLKESVLDGDPHLEQMAALLADSWHSLYDADDPSMASDGEDGWEEQVMTAVESFKDRVAELAAQVEDDLMNGEFYLDK
jgi:hypothetical protein